MILVLYKKILEKRTLCKMVRINKYELWWRIPLGIILSGNCLISFLLILIFHHYFIGFSILILSILISRVMCYKTFEQANLSYLLYLQHRAGTIYTYIKFNKVLALIEFRKKGLVVVSDDDAQFIKYNNLDLHLTGQVLEIAAESLPMGRIKFKMPKNKIKLIKPVLTGF